MKSRNSNRISQTTIKQSKITKSNNYYSSNQLKEIKFPKIKYPKNKNEKNTLNYYPSKKQHNYYFKNDGTIKNKQAIFNHMKKRSFSLNINQNCNISNVSNFITNKKNFCFNTNSNCKRKNGLISKSKTKKDYFSPLKNYNSNIFQKNNLKTKIFKDNDKINSKAKNIYNYSQKNSLSKLNKFQNDTTNDKKLNKKDIIYYSKDCEKKANQTEKSEIKNKSKEKTINHSNKKLIKKSNTSNKTKNKKFTKIRNKSTLFSFKLLKNNKLNSYKFQKQNLSNKKNITPFNSNTTSITNFNDIIQQNISEFADFKITENSIETSESMMINYNLGEKTETPFSSKLLMKKKIIKNLSRFSSEREKTLKQISREAKEFLNISKILKSNEKISKKVIKIKDSLDNIAVFDNDNVGENFDFLCYDIEEFKEEERNKNIINIFLK